MSLVSRAATFAANAHAGHTRKAAVAGGDYFHEHLLVVAELVAAAGGSDAAIAAAYLHDAVEDTDVTLGELEALFGAEVAGIVDAVTKAPKAPGDTYLTGTAAYLVRLAGGPREAALVAVADKLANTATLVLTLAEHGPAVMAKFNGTLAEKAAYHHAVAGIAEEAGYGTLAALLRTATDRVVALAG